MVRSTNSQGEAGSLEAASLRRALVETTRREVGWKYTARLLSFLAATIISISPAPALKAAIAAITR